MSKIHRGMSQAQLFQSTPKGKSLGTKKSEKGQDAEKASGQLGDSFDELPDIGLGSLGRKKKATLEQNYDAAQGNSEAIDLIEQQQRKLQEGGIGKKLFGGTAEVEGKALQRNLAASDVSPLNNIESLQQQSAPRRVTRASWANDKADASIEAQQTGSIGKRLSTPDLGDDLPRVGLNLEKK